MRAVVLPTGGAAIVIPVPRQIARSDSELPRTLDGWVGLGTRPDVEIETPAGREVASEVKTLAVRCLLFGRRSSCFS